eukprot:TRINITY_DN66193_c0_g1_i1.p1 TRINITY_DN66193_c0_g1~~TRINITY_DN66193_c0_g1_i1.p1  ORF type:complete len:1171 (+),score=242.51 TRINITY_DN66193_c0_g1_i1:41-3514(+)
MADECRDLKLAQLASMLEIGLEDARLALTHGDWDLGKATQYHFNKQSSVAAASAPSWSGRQAAWSSVASSSAAPRGLMAASAPPWSAGQAAGSSAASSSAAPRSLMPAGAPPGGSSAASSSAAPGGLMNGNASPSAKRRHEGKKDEKERKMKKKEKRRKKKERRHEKAKKQKEDQHKMKEGSTETANQGKRTVKYSRSSWTLFELSRTKNMQELFAKSQCSDPPSLSLSRPRSSCSSSRETPHRLKHSIELLRSWQTPEFDRKVKKAASDYLANVRFPPLSVECRWQMESGSKDFKLPKELRRSSEKLQPLPPLKATASLCPTAQPPRFTEYPLRDEQLRSLQWMLQRENDPGEFHVDYRFFAERNKESKLKLRFQGKAKATYLVRGGVLADKMGYGKTANVIALMDATHGNSVPAIPSMDQGCFFQSKATLILVPPNLLGQWQREIFKFTEGAGEDLSGNLNQNGGWLRREHNECCPFSILVLPNVYHLKRSTVKAIQKADVVIASYRLLWSQVYLKRRAQFAECFPVTCPLWRIREQTRQLIARDTSTHVAQHVDPPQDEFKAGGDPGTFMFPLLEQFFWRRVVFDEFHELASESFQDKQNSLQHVRSHYRWALTGTPPLNVTGILFMSSLFRIDLPGRDVTNAAWLHSPHLIKQCGAFLDTFVRQNAPDTSHIKLIEHIISVRLSKQERLLYLSQARDVGVVQSSEGLTPGRNAAFERLVKLCSHFQAGVGNVANAEEECQRITNQKERRMVMAKNQVSRCWRAICILDDALVKQQADFNWQEILDAHLNEMRGTPEREEVAELCMDAASQAKESMRSGTCLKDLEHHEPRDPELRDRLLGLAGERKSWARAWEQLALHPPGEDELKLLLKHQAEEQLENFKELVEAKSSLDFLRQTLRLLKDKASPQERACAVCLEEDLPLPQLAITPCSHVFCLSCLTETVKAFQACSICRSRLELRDITPVVEELETPVGSAASSSSAGVQGPAKEESTGVSDGKFSKYGSKISEIVETLRRIRTEDAVAKIIIFAQFDDLKVKLRDAFRDFGLPAAVLQGSTAQRDKTIVDWQNDPQSHQYILLLSLEHSASGTNLTAANHVMLVHPMLANSPDEAASFEAQALGRVKRHGQEREAVHVWRFVTKDTIEEELTKQNRRGQ